MKKIFQYTCMLVYLIILAEVTQYYNSDNIYDKVMLLWLIVFKNHLNIDNLLTKKNECKQSIYNLFTIFLMFNYNSS